TPTPPLKGRGLRLPIVFDPVMVATSGDTLADTATIAAFERLASVATLVTPNLAELATLSGLISGPDAVKRAAIDYATRVGTPVLAKGGHGPGDQIVDWLAEPDGNWTRWRHDRIDTDQSHGTGCTLASAIATYLAYGTLWKSAIVRARQFVRLALHDAPGLGGGQGPMGHQMVRLDLGPGVRLNQVTVPMRGYAASRDFYALLGLKQIVDTDDHHYARFETAGGATLSIESGARLTIFFECENLDAEVERLQGAGIIFDQLPTDQSWLWREARLTDPAGNVICLYKAYENRRYPPWRLPDA
ncbi:bifunctional hydroxymethylpyrimidine kinase/phosphomethylpyrimidine kinase, partial [Sphingomonas sp. HMWF008]